MRKKHVVALTDDQRAALDERDRGPLTRRERPPVPHLKGALPRLDPVTIEGSCVNGSLD
jgi:hypothetical protein